MSSDPNAANLTDLIAQCGDGLTKFIVNPDGTLLQVFYDPNPTAGTFRGGTGVWVSYLKTGDDVYSGHYNIFQDAFTGGQMATQEYIHLFVPAAAFTNFANAYLDKPGFSDYFGASFQVFEGVVETGFGVWTYEIGIGEYLIVDGTSRTILAGAKIYALATSGKSAAEAIPKNMGGMAGQAIDFMTNSNGLFQSSLGTVNDFATLFATAGLPGLMMDLSEGLQEILSAKGVFQADFGANGIYDLYDFLNDATNNH